MILDRPRLIFEILRDALSLYRADWRTYLLVCALVIVPAELLVMGVALGELSAGYTSQTNGELLVALALQQLVTVPLSTAMAIAIVLGRLREQPVGAREAIQAGLDVFAPLLAAMLLVAVGVGLGLLLLVVPGVFLAIRLIAVVPAVVVEGHRTTAALDRSWRLTEGSWWRALGTVLVVNLVGLIATAPIVVAAASAAESSDAQWPTLAGSIVGQVLTVPLTAIGITLLFGDLRARKAARDGDHAAVAA